MRCRLRFLPFHIRGIRGKSIKRDIPCHFKHCRILGNNNDLLLQYAREASVLQKQVIIISQNPAVLEMARNVSFDTLSANAADVERQEAEAAAHVTAPASYKDERDEQEDEVQVRVIRDENIRIPSSYNEALMSSPSGYGAKKYDREEESGSAPQEAKDPFPLGKRVRGKSLTWKFVAVSFVAASVL